MTWVKICGITNLEDAMTAVEAGADALGFVFYEKSPRRVDVETAREIVAKLPERVEKVGVFPGADWEAMIDVTQRAGFSAMQLYLGESNFSAASLLAPQGTKTFAAISASSFLDRPNDLDKIIFMLRLLMNHESNGRLIHAVLLDSGTTETPGGTGSVFDWQESEKMMSTISKTFKVVVAGGLNSSNVADAMRILCPWGVDVASGVEARPGKKDPEKVKAFIAAVRAADNVH